MTTLVCQRHVSDIRQEGFLSPYLWMFSFVHFLNIGLYRHISVCVQVDMHVCLDFGGFYGTSVTLPASVLHHVEWALVGRYVGGEYTETHL